VPVVVEESVEPGLVDVVADDEGYEPALSVAVTEEPGSVSVVEPGREAAGVDAAGGDADPGAE